MRKQVELYIDNGDGYSRVDLFDFEDINYVSRIQDVKDIAKVLTDYSHTFTVPASGSNNKLFKHYYNYAIISGFDARYKRDAIIKINGVDFREGQVSLQKANLKSNKAYSYSLTFYGKTVSLKQLFGKDELDVLTASQSGLLNDYTASYDAAFASDGFSEGYKVVNGVLTRQFNGNNYDYCFPFISADDYHYYDSGNGLSPVQGGNNSRNIHPSATYNASIDQYTGVKSTAMKPAIRVDVILRAIEEKYNITFSDDFFDSSNPEYYGLFMWLNRETGTLDSQIGESDFDFSLDDFTYSSGTTDIIVNGNQFPASGTGIGKKRYTFAFDITPDNATGLYSWDCVDAITGTIHEGGEENTSGTRNCGITIDRNIITQPIIRIRTNGGIQSATISNGEVRREIFEWDGGSPPQYEYDGQTLLTYDNTNQPVLSIGLDVGRNLPKMTIVGFLDTLFKMFNLTAYFRNGEIVVQTLNEFYDTGKYYDISEYVDVATSEVSKVLLYNEIDFLYKGQSTFALIQSNNITNDEFGNERVDHNSAAIDSPLAFDGNKNYKVELGLEKMMYETMTDQADEDVVTDIQWGWMASKDQTKIKGKPMFMYLDKQTSSTQIRYSYIDGGTSVLKTQYIVPTNVINIDSVTTDGNQTLNWGSEYNEHNGSIVNNSLFDTYYKRYITDVYNEQARLLKISANFPASLLLQLLPNDKMVINGKSFKVNKYETNLSTGKTKLELVTEVNINDNVDSIKIGFN